MSYTITDKCNGCQACTKICPVDAISGEKKAAHSIDPSGCLDCGACGRVCPQGAILDKAGMVCVMLKRSQWKKPRLDEGRCMSCEVCVDSCPVNCLGHRESSNARNLHLYPFLEREKACLGCGFCQLDCPVGAISMVSP
jgi:Na+-translocating ferredoxin:NAD+ oxidoreductase subunit B